MADEDLGPIVLIVGDRRRSDMPEKKLYRTDSKQSSRPEFQKASLDELFDAFVPVVDDAAISRLMVLLIEAQETAPNDKAAFVQKINRLLDLFHLRISANGEPPGRLALTGGRSIQVTASGGGCRGFTNATIRLIRIPENAIGKHRVTWPKKLNPVAESP